MPEYIERGALMGRLQMVRMDKSHFGVAVQFGINCAMDFVKEADAADVAPVVHGRWEQTKYPIMSECEDCSVCGYRTVYGHGFKFCPNCGAKMDLEDEK